MRNIPGLRLRTDGRWENDFNAQSVLSYREDIVRSGIPDVGRWSYRAHNSSSNGIQNLPEIQLLRSSRRSTLPIAPYFVRPTTAYGYIPNWLPLVFTGSFGVKDDLGNIDFDMEGYTYLVPTGPSVFDTDFSDKIAGRILSKFRVLDSEIGIIIAELGETLKMLNTAVNRVRAGLAIFKRGRLTDLKKEYERLSGKSWEVPKLGNLWLEFRYGWTPFFHDIQSLVKDFNKLNKQLVKIARVSAGHGELVTQKHRVNLTGPFIVNIMADLEVTYEVRQRYGYFVLECPGYAELVGDKFTQITSADVFVEKIFNPASTGWDLVPYSFVVDWFFNLGEYLRQSGSLYHNYQIIDGYQRTDCRISSVNVTSDDKTFYMDGKFSHEVGSYLRMKTLKFPHYQPNLDLSFSSVKHLVDSIFLSTQRIKR